MKAVRSIVVCLLALSLWLAGECRAENNVPQSGGRLVLGTIGEPSNLNPYISMDSASHDVADSIFVSPLRYDKNLNLELWAAESVDLSDDGRTLTIRLKKGILWEDGTEMTADDLVYTIETVAKPETGSPYAEDFMRIKSVEALDRYTVRCTYESYYARALPSFCSSILPKHILQGQDWRRGEFARKPVGAGPFRLAGWESGSMVTLAANDKYFMGRPKLDEVVYRVIPDSATMFMELRAKRLDMMGLSPEQYLLQTKGQFWQEEFHKYRYLSSAYTYLGFNMRHPFFKDKRVRRAISCAINREELVQGALLGQGVAAFGPYKPGTAYYHPELKPVKQNTELAKALLAEAGFADTDGDGILDKDGKPLSFIILTNQGNNERILAATIIQRELKDVGIAVQVRTVEWAAFINEFVNKGSFDAVILGWTITPDPDLYQVWHSSQAVPGGLNFTGFISKELDVLLEEGRRTQNEDLRRQLYYRVQELLDEEQPYCFLYVPYALPVLSAKFQGIEPALAGITWNMDKWWVQEKQAKDAPAVSPR
ncbi:MAG: peptide-binding protein [Desulfovibrionaceae bacterium]|nr:peptide-binding protein [Desulfovibrionaceae bacterium]